MNITDQLADALRAIVARHNGDFDNPALVPFGALGSTSDDIQRISREALAAYDAQRCGHSACSQNFIDTGDSACTKKLEPAELATILAALRYYQWAGMGDPENRSEDLHDIATASDTLMSSLDEKDIDELCEKLNTGDL